MPLHHTDRSAFAQYREQILLPPAALIEIIDQVIGRGCVFRFLAPGDSMAPWIKSGDILSLAPINKKWVGVGNVVAFRFPETDKINVHRIIAIKKAGFLIKGDNNNKRVDGIIPREFILGNTVKIERNGSAVRFGLGRERFVIAFLSRFDLLIPLLSILKKCVAPWRRRKYIG